MLPIHTILFPTDFSESAERVFPLACALARDCGARIVVLHVQPPPVGHEQVVARYDPDECRLPALLELHKITAPDQNVRVEHRLEDGDAASQICKIAEEIQAGLIVMPTHGRSGVGRLLMGSVAEQVLRKAPCPVLTVRNSVAAELVTHEQPALAN
jgi:nucleotide-binding universal stress UspA family protein